jgi:hypothetical protein
VGVFRDGGGERERENGRLLTMVRGEGWVVVWRESEQEKQREKREEKKRSLSINLE